MTPESIITTLKKAPEPNTPPHAEETKIELDPYAPIAVGLGARAATEV